MGRHTAKSSVPIENTRRFQELFPLSKDLDVAKRLLNGSYFFTPDTSSAYKLGESDNFRLSKIVMKLVRLGFSLHMKVSGVNNLIINISANYHPEFDNQLDLNILSPKELEDFGFLKATISDLLKVYIPPAWLVNFIHPDTVCYRVNGLVWYDNSTYKYLYDKTDLTFVLSKKQDMHGYRMQKKDNTHSLFCATHYYCRTDLFTYPAYGIPAKAFKHIF